MILIISFDTQLTGSQDTHLLLTGGLEKVLRIYDLNRPDAAPREVDKSPGSIRTVAWLHSDQTILSSCTDLGGVRYAILAKVLNMKCLFSFISEAWMVYHVCPVFYKQCSL